MPVHVTRLTTATALAAAFAVPAVAAAPASAAKKTTITMSGSTSMYPLVTALTKKYSSLNSKVSFRVAQGGSDKGITDASKGRVTIGNSSRDPRSDDPKGSNFYRVAKDAVCLITNPANKLANGLTQKQVQDIFSGKIRSWSDIPGAQQTGTISLQARNEASGTLDAFENLFMGGASLSSTAARLGSNGLIQAAVKRDPAAIGFVSIEFTEGVSAASYQGVTCTTANAKSGAYKGTRSFWMVTKGAPKGETARFVNWVRTSSAARKIVVAQKAVPLK
ncbi:phosphate ABC transporter substrate-binding protein [Patulibacter minatonensis]|uniref:phosphate ABC transporter substrate-binding protein n=1 Tax=Patulibacter minatonensis TaxID=298163 RepID=UPI0012FBC47B|nr:phosphate ABC transporter substrate-binding protein [Patulibacter minatonensis]